MKLEEIIDILGKNINRKLIIKRQLNRNPTFKAFVTYTIEVYGKQDKKFILLHTTECTYKEDTITIEDVEKQFLEEFIDKWKRL